MELMLITNNCEIASYAERSGVDRIFIDLEILGKKERQGHLDTHITNHKIEDIMKVKSVLTKASIVVRINPLNQNSESEIEKVIKSGADIIMLPMFKSNKEVEKFIRFIDGRTKTSLLLETPEALARIGNILNVNGIDEVHIGLNDLHLGLKLSFMFELLSGGLVDFISSEVIKRNIKLGIGGIARIGHGDISSERILKEHARLGSEITIMSRSFIPNRDKKDSYNNINLVDEVGRVKEVYKEALSRSPEEIKLDKNEINELINNKVEKIISGY